MQVPRPTDEDLARFRSLVPDEPDVEVRPMFGNLGAFVHGNMFMGLLGADIGLKLDGDDVAALRAVDGGRAFGPPGRPMAGWALLPADLIGGPTGAGWVASALAFIRTLPPKPRRSRPGTAGR